MSVTTATNRAETRGRAAGAAILAYFALAWAGWGVSTGVPAAVEIPVMVVAGLCFVALAVGTVVVFRAARTRPPGDMDRRAGRAIGRRFGLVVLAEFAVIAVVARLLAAFGHEELIPAFVCLAVGVHFFPLRRLFAVPMYDATGAALCAIAVITAPAVLLLGAPVLWTALPGFASAIVLNANSVLLLRSQWPARRQA